MRTSQSRNNFAVKVRAEGSTNCTFLETSFVKDMCATLLKIGFGFAMRLQQMKMYSVHNFIAYAAQRRGCKEMLACVQG
jgi:alpha-galactosidase